MNHYRISYFPEVGGKRSRYVVDESTLPFMHYVSHIRGLQSGGGQGALPGIVDVHLGPILVEELEPGNMESISCYLIHLQPAEELVLARDIRDKVGIKSSDIPSTIRLLANLNDRAEKEIILLRSRLNAANDQLEKLNASIA